MPYANISHDPRREIESLRAELKESGLRTKSLEVKLTNLASEHEAEKTKLKDELSHLRVLYDRLVSSHENLSKLNHSLEDRLISTIETSNAEKSALSEQLEATRSRLADSENTLAAVTDERNQYKEDCSTATALLHANPDQFLSQISNTSTVPRVSSSYFPTFPPVGLHMFPMDSEGLAPTTSCRLASSSSPSYSSSSPSSSAKDKQSRGYVTEI